MFRKNAYIWSPDCGHVDPKAILKKCSHFYSNSLKLCPQEGEKAVLSHFMLVISKASQIMVHLYWQVMHQPVRTAHSGVPVCLGEQLKISAVFGLHNLGAMQNIFTLSVK